MMTDEELRKLRDKVDQADKMNATIRNIDKIINELNTLGKCEGIWFGSWDKADSDGFGMVEEDENYWRTTEITPASLGISKETFDIWYTEHILIRLLDLKSSVLKEYNEL